MTLRRNERGSIGDREGGTVKLRVRSSCTTAVALTSFADSTSSTGRQVEWCVLDLPRAT